MVGKELMKMKAIQIEKPEVLKIIDMEKPVLTQQDNVIVKMKAAGICGSDVGIYHGTNAAATYPRVIGHEMVGIIEEVGPGVTRVKPGDRVRHKVFGEGTITGIRGDIGCYVVKFDRVETERNLKIGVGLDKIG